MTDRKKNLTGVWHGLYSFPAFLAPVYFVATIIHSGDRVSGTTHESDVGKAGAPLTRYASIAGSCSGTAVDFLKTYDGTGDWHHTVTYSGTLSDDATEIEGMWTVDWSGRFLMIRGSGVTESVARRVYETV